MNEVIINSLYTASMHKTWFKRRKHEQIIDIKKEVPYEIVSLNE